MIKSLVKNQLRLKGLLLCLLLLTTSLSYSQNEGGKVNENSTDLKTKQKASKVPGKLAKIAENNAALSSIVGGGSGWRLQGSLEHIPKLRRDQEDTSEILTRADYTFNKSHRVRVEQSFTKFYSVYNNENEFKPSDTNLAHYYSVPYKPKGINMLWRSGLSIPISNDSARDDLITRFTGSMINSKAFFNNKLIAFFVPFARYHWYEYNMSKSGGHRPWYTLGTGLTGLYFITPNLSVAAGMSYNYETQRQSQFDQAPSQVNNGTYQFDLGASYQINNELSASLSYFQGASYIQNGRYELAVFDDQNSRVSFGLTYIY